MKEFKKQHQTKTDFEAVGESGTFSQTPLLCACPAGFELCFSIAGTQAVTQPQQGLHRSEVPPSVSITRQQQGQSWHCPWSGVLLPAAGGWEWALVRCWSQGVLLAEV